MRCIGVCLISAILFGISYAKQPNDAKVKQHVELAENCISNGELDIAYKYLQDAESLTMDKKQLAYIYKEMGEIAERKMHYTDAILYYTRSLILAKNSRYRELEIVLNEKISNIQSRMLITSR
jgi:ADP-dependent phosphofructokinase/glucokinase